MREGAVEHQAEQTRTSSGEGVAKTKQKRVGTGKNGGGEEMVEGGI